MTEIVAAPIPQPNRWVEPLPLRRIPSPTIPEKEQTTTTTPPHIPGPYQPKRKAA